MLKISPIVCTSPGCGRIYEPDRTTYERQFAPGRIIARCSLHRHTGRKAWWAATKKQSDLLRED
jgi:hypothetical protein